MLTLDDVLIHAPGVVSRQSDDELVVVLPERGKFIVLNGTGAEVFQGVDGQRSLEQIAATLIERYDADPQQVQADVLTFAADLLDRGAVQRQAEPERG